MNIEIRLANYSDPDDAKALGYLLDVYAQDQMGGAEALPQSVKENLAAELSKLPYAFTVLSLVDNEPAGLVNCFEAFSTFKCQPLINIHDVIVDNAFRGLGLSQKMMAKVQEIAINKGCCKLTLEVLEGNETAKKAYEKFGFEGYELDPLMGKALFWQKSL